MATDKQQIQLSKEAEDKLKNELDRMIEEAESFRGSSEWDTLHADFWRMYRSDPKQKVRDWPWLNASNLYIPLVKTAVNTTIAQEYQAMLSVTPKVVSIEPTDEDQADALTTYYFGYLFKRIFPLEIWGCDLMLDNGIDGISGVKIRQNTDYIVRREEYMKDVPVYEEVPITALDGSIYTEKQIRETKYEWDERATIERQDQTYIEVADMQRIFMASDTVSGLQPGSSLYSDNCGWYYQQNYLSWNDLIQRKRSLGYNLKVESDKDLKAFMGEETPTEKDKKVAEREGTKAGSPIDKLEVLEFYMAWQLPQKYTLINGDGNKIIDQTSSEEDGYLEEVVVTYAPRARHILLIRPLSRVCPDGKRPHTTMHYRRQPRFIYGMGLPSEMRDLQAGMNKSWNQMMDYGDLSNMPWGLYSPGQTGLLPELGALQPGRMYEVMDPRGVYFPKFNMDVNYYFGINQAMQAWAEKVSLASDMMQGRAPTTPNAPRTARGQMMLLQQANAGFGVLTAQHAMSFKEVFHRVHAFKRRFAKPEESFRILNKKTGIFEKRTITDRAFQSEVDFDFTLMPDQTMQQQADQVLYGMTISGIKQAIESPLLADTIRSLLGEMYQAFNKKNFDIIWPQDKIEAAMQQNQMNAAQNQKPGPPNEPPQGPNPQAAPMIGGEQNINPNLGQLQ